MTFLKNDFPRYHFDKPNTLTFDEPDIKTFRNLYLATEAMRQGGNAPCVMNAANEIAVYAFLKNRIGFLDMTELIERTMEKIPFIAQPSLDDYFESDGAYTYVVTAEDRVLSSKNIGYYEKTLPAESFKRPHHSYIVNIDKIHLFKKGRSGILIMQNEKEIPVSQRKMNDFLDYFIE